MPAIFRLATADVLKMLALGRRQPVFELWSIVLGVPPPVPGAAQRNRNVPGALTCLNHAHALFRGIERPLAEDDDGADVLAYVLKPVTFFEYNPDMVSVALKVPVPGGYVFVAYARLQGLVGGPDDARGRVTHWGFVEADKSDPDLPVDYASRYRTRLW